MNGEIPQNDLAGEDGKAVPQGEGIVVSDLSSPKNYRHGPR